PRSISLLTMPALLMEWRYMWTTGGIHADKSRKYLKRGCYAKPHLGEVSSFFLNLDRKIISALFMPSLG
ncbi:MAG: hypothetical protein WBV62_02405, partial [Roseobacter sp.]